MARIPGGGPGWPGEINAATSNPITGNTKPRAKKPTALRSFFLASDEVPRPKAVGMSKNNTKCPADSVVTHVPLHDNQQRGSNCQTLSEARADPAAVFDTCCMATAE